MFVLLVIRARLARADLADVLAEPDSDGAKEIAEKIKAQRGRLVQVEQDYDNDLIDGTRYKIKREKIRAEPEDAEAAQLRLAAPLAVAGTLRAPDPVAAFDNAPLGVRRAVIAFFVSVRLKPAMRGRHFDASTVELRDARTGQLWPTD